MAAGVAFAWAASLAVSFQTATPPPLVSFWPFSSTRVPAACARMELSIEPVDVHVVAWESLLQPAAILMYSLGSIDIEKKSRTAHY